VLRLGFQHPRKKERKGKGRRGEAKRGGGERGGGGRGKGYPSFIQMRVTCLIQICDMPLLECGIQKNEKRRYLCEKAVLRKDCLEKRLRYTATHCNNCRGLAIQRFLRHTASHCNTRHNTAALRGAQFLPGPRVLLWGGYDW